MRKPEAVDLLPLLQLAQKELEAEHPGVAILLEAEAIPTIEADREQLRFLLKALLSNAVKFRKPGHEVHLKLYASTLLLNQFRQLKDKYKYVPYLKLQLQDEGLGFEGQYAEQAFDFFRKLHPAPTEGLGIGLSLCRKIVENHGGWVYLESQTGIGTTVTLFLILRQEKTDS